MSCSRVWEGPAGAASKRAHCLAGGRRRQEGSTRTRPQHKELQPDLGGGRREQPRSAHTAQRPGGRRRQA
eukprot:10312066-Alexandrium_andersonii.AAC.1